MGEPAVDETLLSKLRGVWLLPLDAKLTLARMKQHEQFGDLPAHLAWNDGVRLRAITLSRIDEGWRATLRGHKGKRPMVAFIRTDSFAHLIEVLSSEAKAGRLIWRDDRYAE